MRKLTCFAVPSLFVLLGAIGVVTGCTESAASSPSPVAADAGTDAEPIGCLASGRLTITVSGLPAGVEAKVKVKGASSTDVTASKDLDLPVGDYTIEASDVAPSDPIVRTLYRPTLSAATAKLCSAPQTITVTYAPIGSSGKLWLGNANGSATTLGYGANVLGATGAVPATVVAKTLGGGGTSFDKDGNLWTIGGTTADPTLTRYPAASLAASGTPAPDRKVNVQNSGCSPSAFHMAFDMNGNLWVSLLCDDRVVRLTPADLGHDGDVTPSVVLTNITAPKGLAFDASGNLWVSANTVHRFDASRLAASTGDAANAVLTLSEDSEYVAFDKDGDLWSVGGSQVNVVHVVKANLGGTGASTPTVASSISVGVAALPQSIAFDESGGLWIATSAGKFARLAKAQLGTSTTYADPTVPERVISSDDVGSAGDIAIFPAPADLPLYHRAL